MFVKKHFDKNLHVFPGLPYLNFLLFKPFFDFQCSFESLERSFISEAYIASYVKKFSQRSAEIKNYVSGANNVFDIISCVFLSYVIVK